jgi:hypothetical protein
MLATLVDWTALGLVAAYSFAFSVAITALFTGGLLLVESGDGGGANAVRRAVGGLLLLACIALIAFGLYIVFTTK